MALNDFAPAAETSGIAEESNLDEDLFDFPLLVSMEKNDILEPAIPEGSAEVEAEPDPASQTAISAEAAPAAEPAPVAAVTAQVETITGLDPELDVDLFGFPPLELPAGMSGAGTEANLEQNIEMAAAAVSELLEDDLGAMTEKTHKEQQKAQAAAAPAPATQAAPVAQAAPPMPAPPLTQPAYAPLPATGQVQTFTVPAGDPRIIWALGGVVAAFMLGLLIVAWRATSNLAPSNGVVSETAKTTGSQDSANMAQQLAILEEILRLQKASTQSGRSTGTGDGLPPMQKPHEITLAVAQKSIDEGRFSEARRMLYGMLATAEQMSAGDRAKAEEEAAYLLARSYRLETKTFEEGAQ